MQFDKAMIRINKKDKIMIYIIQGRFVWILYNEIDLGMPRVTRLFPSRRNEQKYPITVIRL